MDRREINNSVRVLVPDDPHQPFRRRRREKLPDALRSFPRSHCGISGGRSYPLITSHCPGVRHGSPSSEKLVRSPRSCEHASFGSKATPSVRRELPLLSCSGLMELLLRRYNTAAAVADRRGASSSLAVFQLIPLTRRSDVASTDSSNYPKTRKKRKVDLCLSFVLTTLRFYRELSIRRQFYYRSRSRRRRRIPVSPRRRRVRRSRRSAVTAL